MQTNYLVYNKKILDGYGRPLISLQQVEHELECFPMALHLYVSYNKLCVSIATEKHHYKIFVILKTDDLRINLDNIIQVVLIRLNEQKYGLSLIGNIVDNKLDVKV